MRVVVACLVLVLAHAVARAGDVVGLVVTGGDALQPEVQKHLEHWLKKHDYKVMGDPLSDDAVITIANCLTVGDPKCASAVVDARGKVDSIVFAKIDIAADKNVTFTTYWFLKGHEGTGERRVCEKCSGDAWHSIADRMMGALRSSVSLGRFELVTKPAGLVALLDNAELGKTPLTRDVLAGDHTLKLVRDGKVVATREVVVKMNDVAHVEVAVDDSGGGSHLLPGLLLGTGIASLTASGVFFLYSAKSGSGEKYLYPDASGWGIATAVVGVGATIGGAVLWHQASRSHPVAAADADGAYIGWITRF
jgi:hypothetical protein